eukprot:g15284.t1
MPLNSVQKSLCAAASRKIFGHIGYTGINVQTGRKQLRRIFRKGQESEIDMSGMPPILDPLLQQRLMIKQARNEERLLMKAKGEALAEGKVRRKAAIEYNENKRKRMLEEEAIRMATGGLSKKDLEKKLSGKADEEEEE